MRELGAHVAVEVPQIDAVFVPAGDEGGVVARAEHHCAHGVGVPDESLEEVRQCFLCLVVPYLKHAVLSASEEVPTVLGDGE